MREPAPIHPAFGAISAGWEVVPIQTAAQMKTGHTPSRQKQEYWENTTIPWFTLADVWQLREGRKHVDETKQKISDLGLRHSAAELLPAKTVLLSRTASVGFTGIAAVPMATSQDFWNWVCGPELMPEYLRYQFVALHDYFVSLTLGSTHRTIYAETAGNMRIVRPPVAVQQRIVDYLDRETGEIDAMIAKLDELSTHLERRRKTVVVSATHQAGLALEGADGAIADLPEGWRLLPLKFAVDDAQTGVWGEDPNGGADDVLCARVADFDRKKINVTLVPTVRRVSEKDRAKCSLERGDILIEKSGGTDRNPVGTVVAYEGETPAVYANFIFRIRLTKEHDPRFWLYALHGSYVGGRTWNYVRQTTGIQNLDVNGFLSMIHAAPTLDEQKRIAEHLDEVTGRIDEMRARVADLKSLLLERRSALITDVVTGRKEIA